MYGCLPFVTFSALFFVLFVFCHVALLAVIIFSTFFSFICILLHCFSLILFHVPTVFICLFLFVIKVLHLFCFISALDIIENDG